ncbi:MAG: asparagine synthase (glutamine-hydrolyzing) [Rhodomicrobium sp.]
MCGIVGCFGKDIHPENTRSIIRSMIQAIAHRGPNEKGQFLERGVGLGHARLSIVGLGDGQQPMSLAGRGLTIVFNGEVFNYIELRDALKAKGRMFGTGSDTEVILHLYDELGENCVSQLNGDFAFAIWDAPRKRMFFARDRMGVRPLYYTVADGTLYFASEVKALLEAPGVNAELDPIALDQIFTLWSPIAPRTPFRDIYELEPGDLMIADENGLTRRPYWSLTFPDRDAEPAYRDEASAAEELRWLLTDATRIRMRADVPVGSYLSGGLDSSIVSALASRMAPGALHTFSIGFASKEHDESEFQLQMAAALGTHHHTIKCDSDDIATIFPKVVEATERPIIRTAPAPLFLLSRLVRDHDMKVVLTGEGADEVFAGYDIFKESRIRRFCARNSQSKFRAHLFRKLYPYLPGVQQQSAQYLAAFFGAGNDRTDDPLYSHRPRFRGTAATKAFFSGDLRARLGNYDAAAELAAILPAEFKRWHTLHQAQYLESRFLLPGYILCSQGDRMAMAHGIEGRFPFLDHRLVEFASKLPPEMKLKGLVEKHILREAMKDLLPEQVAKRTKQPYRAPDSLAFVGPREPEYVREALGERSVAANGLFNPTMVRKLLEKCRANPGGGFRDNAAFVGILSSQLWVSRFAKAQTTETLAA